ncbi:MAG TPA: CehA/McbA family metallohydrolase [Chloroflexota bacterium]
MSTQPRLVSRFVRGDDAPTTGVAGTAGTLPVYFGDLHNHTGYSDGRGRPEQAYAQLRARGLHFAAITDHGEMLAVPAAAREGVTPATSMHQALPPHGMSARDDLAAQAALATRDNFLAMRSFEWTSAVQGHVSVWGSAGFTDANRLGHECMAGLWAWLARPAPEGGADGLAGLNHPGAPAGQFHDFAYHPELEGQLATFELFNRDADYFSQHVRALDQGWHLGAIGVSDHHGEDWGSPTHAACGLLAPRLTWHEVAAALRARRVYATRERGLGLSFTGNGEWLGSRLTLAAGEPLVLEIRVERAPDGSPLECLEVWGSGGYLLGVRDLEGCRRACWTMPVRPPPARESWYLARVTAANRALAYSTPIWVRPV